jgi:muconate cycloisomerase
MTVTFRRIRLKKLFPLAISRGISTGSENLYVFVERNGHTGIGEAAWGTGYEESQAGKSELELMEFASRGLEGKAILEVWDEMKEAQIDPPAMAALDTALWDLFAKECGQPMYRIFGLPKRSVPTSVTIGINPPEVTRERVPIILEKTRAKFLKIKLGSPEGTEHDKAHFEAAREAARPFGAGLRVDANGGWELSTAKSMLKWLADRGVAYVEQPLVEGAEDQLPELYRDRPLPIFVDESCRFSTSIPKLAGHVDGINLKLMKCGGPTEALRIVAAARAHGMQTMIGCMSEGSVAIGAGAAIGSLFDHIDLDSHLNLAPDPGQGLDFVEGVVTPRDVPGHGVALREEA